jgi:Amt family ammonium transporter
VSPLGAIIIGAVGAVVAIIAIDVIEWFRVDDPIGAVAVHGVAGIWGTLSVGFFATGEFGIPGATGADISAGTVTGLFYGGGTTQLMSQLIGIGVVVGLVLAAGLVLMYGINFTKQLRIPAEMELEGVDIHEHGGSAYHPEFAFMGTGASSSSSS